jgi:hypothetical protein
VGKPDSPNCDFLFEIKNKINDIVTDADAVCDQKILVLCSKWSTKRGWGEVG